MSDVGAETPATQSWDERNIWRAALGVRTAWLLGFVAVFYFVPMLADRWAYDHVWHNNLYDLDWARFLREMGWLPTWGVAALAMWLITQRRGGTAAATATASATADATSAAAVAGPSPRAALYLVLAPTVSGIACEVLKLLIRRERPELYGGEYGFRAWSDHPFSTAGLASPSSHAMVSFAAATALARIFPRARWVWYSLAAGCAATRVIARAHFVSDVTLGALLGWSVGWGVWIAMRRRRGSLAAV